LVLVLLVQHRKCVSTDKPCYRQSGIIFIKAYSRNTYIRKI
jgi:hypothetical protein